MMEFVNGKDDNPYIVENKKSCLKPPTSDEMTYRNSKVARFGKFYLSRITFCGVSMVNLLKKNGKPAPHPHAKGRIGNSQP